MEPRLFLLTGAPGSGKSTLLGLLKDIADFDHEIVPKITTRRRRKDDGIEIEPVDHTNTVPLRSTPGLLRFVEEHAASYSYDTSQASLTVKGPLPHEELIQIKKALVDDLPMRSRLRALQSIETLARRANTFPNKYDLIYEQYNVRYGLASVDLVNLIVTGRAPVAIVNDIRVLRDIRSMFGDRAVFIFVFSPLDQINLADLQHKRGAVDASGQVDEAQILRRIEKAKVILRRYFENIALFDHVIINHLRDPSELASQMAGIVRSARTMTSEFVVSEDLTE